MANLTDAQRHLFDGWLYAWLRAADLQMQRVDPGRGGTFGDGQIDGMLFALAVANVDRAATAVLGEEHPAVVAYRSAVPAGKAIRDMLTHFDEYVRDRGRLQRSGKVEDFNVFFQRDGETVTLHVAGQTMRVADAYAAASDLALAALSAAESRNDDNRN